MWISVWSFMALTHLLADVAGDGRGDVFGRIAQGENCIAAGLARYATPLAFM